MYKVLENQHTSKSNEDPFMKAILVGYSQVDWERSEKARLRQKVLEMKMGDFHEELMGKFPGYETYPNGHPTKCDVGSLDGRTLFEVKNRDNTVKASDGRALVDRLKQLTDIGKRAILVQVNCVKVNRYNADPAVEVWDGQQAYAFLSGRESFFKDLLDTVQYVFSHFATYSELKQSLGIV